jgi:hypothetical protein
MLPMTQIAISFDTANITAASLADLLEAVGFGSSSAYLSISEFHGRFFCPGTVGVFAVHLDTRQLVGMARVFTDDVFTTYISELCVHPVFQKKGIGSGSLKAITERFGHTAIFADAFRANLSTFSKHGIAPKEKLIACSRRPHLPNIVTH